MLKKVNNLIVEAYQNFYMKKNPIENQQDNYQYQQQQNKKDFRSFDDFCNYCKKFDLSAEIQKNDDKDDKYIIINLMLIGDNNQPVKFEYYDKNNQEYFRNNYKIFKALQRFFQKHIITKDGKQSFPIYILG